MTGIVSGLRCGPIPGARLDFWQADATGRLDQSGHGLRGRQVSDASGGYRLTTVRPGARPGRAPHISARVVAPTGPSVWTELFFAGDPANARDGRCREELALLLRPSATGHQARFDFVLDLLMTTPAPVRAVLADLDDTLFDHAHATRSALARLRGTEPALAVWPFEELEVRHGEVLERLHREVLEGKRTIDEARIARFAHLLAHAGADRVTERAEASAVIYRQAYQTMWRAVAGATSLLQALAAEGVPVVIVTNNGTQEQRGKMAGCGLTPFVHALVTSEEFGVPKPDTRIFQHALARAGATAAEAVMLGDAWATDIEGARAAGIRPVWLNRLAMPSPDGDVAEIASLEPTAATLRVLLRRP